MRFLKNINIIKNWGRPVSQETFAQILELTDQMLNSAKEAQWDDLFSLEKHRDGLIKKYFVDTLLKDEMLADSVRQVLKKDQQIQNEVRQERDRLAQELKKVTQGKNAVKSYATVG